MSDSVKNISVITGGAGGMGLAAAKILGRDHHVIISDINPQRLEQAATELQQLGIGCDAIVCDIADQASVDALAKQSAALGRIVSVIHTAGLSPQMADPAAIIKVNAVGTVHIANAFYPLASDGFTLVNVASMAAHLLPGLLIRQRAYALAFTDLDALQRKLLFPCRLMPKDFYRKGMAYSISKHFVIWYSKKLAARFGEKGARVVSVSPGTFDTDMGRLEEKSGAYELLQHAALKRSGKPREIAELLAFCASDKASYLTGVDILCDGGVVAGKA